MPYVQLVDLLLNKNLGEHSLSVLSLYFWPGVILAKLRSLF